METIIKFKSSVKWERKVFFHREMKATPSLGSHRVLMLLKTIFTLIKVKIK